MKFAHSLTRPQKLFVVCTAIFLTALVVAEATASKFFTAFTLPFSISILGVEFNEVIMTAGVLAFPITFIITDLINEYFGKPGIAVRDLYRDGDDHFRVRLAAACDGSPDI